MLEMLLFWCVYGAWMVFTWTAVVGILVMGVSKVVGWITDGDYTLEHYVDWFKDVVDYHTVSFIFFVIGAIVTLAHVFVSTILSLSDQQDNIKSFHEFAVIISEWTSTTLQTPLLITLVVIGIVFLLKKAYPLFKKIKTLTDTLK
ncbi:hypothetical protein [Pseudoalteromonas phage PH357]|nr:hypothetical protein [Pseudoalteromonas phage PH357]